MAAGRARASRLSAHGRPRKRDGARQPLGRHHRVTAPRRRRAPVAAPGSHRRRALRIHRDRGGLDGHRGWTPTVGGPGHPPHRGRGDPDARAHRAARRVHAALRRARRRRRPGDHRAGAGDDVRGVLASIGLPELIAGIMVLALNAYVLMGGADFGGGVWDLLATGPRRTKQRELIAKTIAPIWEANHVWLIVVVVTLFTAFPVAYGTIGTVLHLPLVLMLIGIVLRGSAFVFRSSGTGRNERWRWGRVFAFSSVIPPVLLGVVIGALATGDVGEAAARVATGSFYAVYVAPWLAPFPIAVGLMALALFALFAAVGF